MGTVDLQSLSVVYMYFYSIKNLHRKVRNIYFNLHVNISCASCVLRSNSTPNLSSSQTLESSEVANDSVR